LLPSKNSLANMQKSSLRLSLRFVSWAVQALIAAAALYVVVMVYLGGQPLLGTAILGLCAFAAYVFTSQKTYAARYLFPGLVGIGLFVVLPLMFTVWIGLTNYSSSNILTLERVTEVLLSKSVRKGDDGAYLFTLHRDGDQVRLLLRSESLAAGDGSAAPDGEGESSIFDEDADADAGSQEPQDAGPQDAGPQDAGPAQPSPSNADAPGPAASPEYVSRPFRLDGRPLALEATIRGDSAPLGPAIELREIITQQTALARITVNLPGGIKLVNTGLRAFAAEQPLYVRGADGGLTDSQSGAVYYPNQTTGFYETASGERVTPGFRVFVAGAHFSRIFTDPAFRGPTMQIFFWTVGFAALSVLFTLIIGALLAELFGWEGLRFRTAYRALLFIPYAIPGFISILVFKGLFNESSGEINLILSKLFGLAPHWFSDAFLAKVMILIVNTWLGYPYMMLLCMGLRQSIPGDLYEASAIAGAGPFTNYFKITWPLIRRPLMPLLISSFAFNFNNFVLIALLTDGRPDIIGTKLPAGTNDILVSYTYRIAFQDAGKNYGLAAAISTVIFLLIAAMSIANLRLTKVSQSESR
jgi:maltose/maltodextrin transport system permease protein